MVVSRMVRREVFGAALYEGGSENPAHPDWPGSRILIPPGMQCRSCFDDSKVITESPGLR